ncbi:hypothetical protein CERZMDRAFT_86696 [Cercospora zeae-maydis SCOH1-5]|uniref:Uncharacterized protein n=1 Tax=Cercospora zeae-maydis SCOH1-5 TaxID=717836 RepID=A0A6A6F8R3_9PEZI|nr:hypothetical protein CERZMDRAFT_86696 [Cercospora zeae-maydis SCOH1-5]
MWLLQTDPQYLREHFSRFEGAMFWNHFGIAFKLILKDYGGPVKRGKALPERYEVALASLERTLTEEFIAQCRHIALLIRCSNAFRQHVLVIKDGKIFGHTGRKPIHEVDPLFHHLIELGGYEELNLGLGIGLSSNILAVISFSTNEEYLRFVAADRDVLVEAIAAQVGPGPEKGEGTTATEALRNLTLRIKVDSASYGVFRRMYDTHCEQQHDTRWGSFVAAMVDAGFSVTAGGGSIFTFKGSESGGSINFNRPHPDPSIDPIMLCIMGKRLNKWFKFDKDTFVERRKEEA